jgi:hypothetical protein
MMKTRLIAVLLLLIAVSINALTGKIALFPELFKGWQFEGSFVFAKEQGRYYPVAPDGSFSVPSEGEAELTLTAYVPGFNKETAAFSSGATDARIVVQVQTVSMEETTYDALVPKWLVNMERSVEKDLKPKEDLLSLVPLFATKGSDGKPQIGLDIGRLILLIERLTRK